jgi:anti-anti-sigma factor
MEVGMAPLGMCVCSLRSKVSRRTSRTDAAENPAWFHRAARDPAGLPSAAPHRQTGTVEATATASPFARASARSGGDGGSAMHDVRRGPPTTGSPALVADGFAIASHVVGEQATIVVTGELDRATAPTLIDEVTRLVSGSVRGIVVDLEDTTFVDLGGLRALVAACAAARASGGDIALRAPPRSLHRVLAVAGADTVFVVTS